MSDFLGVHYRKRVLVLPMHIVSWIYRPFEPYNWIASALIRSEMYSLVKRKKFGYQLWHFLAKPNPRKWTTFLNNFLDSCWNWFLLNVRLHLGRIFFSVCTWAAHFLLVCIWAAHFFSGCTWAAHFFLVSKNCSFGRFSSCFLLCCSWELVLTDCRTELLFACWGRPSKSTGGKVQICRQYVSGGNLAKKLGKVF